MNVSDTTVASLEARAVGALVALRQHLQHDVEQLKQEERPLNASISLVTGPPGIGKSSILSPTKSMGPLTSDIGWIRMYDAEQVSDLGLDPYDSVNVAMAVFISLINEYTKNIKLLYTTELLQNGKLGVDVKNRYISALVNPAGASVDEVVSVLHFFFAMFGIRSYFNVICLWIPFKVYELRLKERTEKTMKPSQDGLRKWHVFNDVVTSTKGKVVEIDAVSPATHEQVIHVKFTKCSGMTDRNQIMRLRSWRNAVCNIHLNFSRVAHKDVVSKLAKLDTTSPICDVID